MSMAPEEFEALRTHMADTVAAQWPGAEVTFVVHGVRDQPDDYFVGTSTTPSVAARALDIAVRMLSAGETRAIPLPKSH